MEQIKDYVSAIKEIATSVTASFDLDTLLQSIVETCTKISKASRGALFLYNDRTKELVMRAEKGNAPGLRFNAKYSININPEKENIGLTPYIYLKKETLVLNSPGEIINHPAHQGKYNNKQYPGKEKCQSLVGIPLVNPVTDVAIGVLKIENTIDRILSMKFSVSEIETFKIMADIASASIVKFQNRLSRLNDSITSLSEAIKGTGSLTDKLRRIVEAFKKITSADGVSIWLIQGSSLICKGGAGSYVSMEDQDSYDISFDLKTDKRVGLTAWIARSGEMINIKSYDELKSHPRHEGKYDFKNYPNPEKKKCESFIGAPLKTGDTIIGVIKADNRIPDVNHPEGYFTEEEAQIFSYLALITAIVVENYQDYERARIDRHIINLYKIGTKCLSIENPNEIFWNLLIGLTHGGGIGFNRVILFDFKDNVNPYLIGKIGVGPRNLEDGKEMLESSCLVETIQEIEKCTNEFRENNSEPPWSKLQSFIKQKRIYVSKEGVIHQLATNSNQPKMEIVSRTEFCDDVRNFLEEIESPYFNDDSYVVFSIPDIDGHPVVGICDYVYSEQPMNAFIRDSSETFLNQIALAITQLSLKRKEEKARDTAWREFSATTAHRIGTETADMGGAVYWIEREIKAMGRNDMNEYCKRLVNSLERMKGFILEYTELTRPPELIKSKIDINDLLEEAIKNVIPENKTSIHIQTAYDNTLPTIYGDKGRILYAFTEILHNALKEIGDDGDLSISTKYNALQSAVEIKITDSGQGIDERIINKIFDRGFKNRKRGTGLGLFIVKKTIEDDHVGKIEAMNVEPHGACFRIILPLKNKEKFKWNRILVVDDTINLRKDIVNLIKDNFPSTVIDEANNEFAAIDLMNKNFYDFVITDIKLDEDGGTMFGGIKILEFIWEKSMDIKTIVITAHQGLIYTDDRMQEKKVLDKANELGAYLCLPRNVLGSNIFDKIIEAIAN